MSEIKREEKKTSKRNAAKLNAAIAGVLDSIRPPEDLTVVEWAEKYRRLSSEGSAETGPWRCDRTPYLREPLEAFTDPKVCLLYTSARTGRRSEKSAECAAELPTANLTL